MENKRGMEREVCFPLWRKRENFTRGKLTLQSYELLNLYALPTNTLVVRTSKFHHQSCRRILHLDRNQQEPVDPKIRNSPSASTVINNTQNSHKTAQILSHLSL